MDAGQIVARAGEPPGMAARRPDHLAIADRGAVIGGDEMGLRIDRDDAAAGEHCHLALNPEGFGAQQNALERFLLREIVLAERRALIGNLGLLADDRDRAHKLALAQRDRRLRAAMACTHDQDVVPRCHGPLPRADPRADADPR